MTNIKVIPGAESFFFEGNEVGCLVIHGFTSSPQVVRYYGERLAAIGGFTVSGPRLPGHGTTMDDLARCTANDFVLRLHEEMKLLSQRCSRLFVTGLSLGGLLTVYLAATCPDIVSGAIPINAAVLMGDQDPLVPSLTDTSLDVVASDAPDTKKLDVEEIVYPGIPLSTLESVYKLADDTRQMLSRLVCPILIMQSRVDHVLTPDNGPYILDHVSSADKHLLWLENSYHVATLDYDKDLIAQQAVDFIRRRQ